MSEVGWEWAAAALSKVPHATHKIGGQETIEWLDFGPKGDYGFREASGKLHEDCREVVPPLVHVRPGSPTSVVAARTPATSPWPPIPPTSTTPPK